jgi:hypothetical protein
MALPVLAKKTTLFAILGTLFVVVLVGFSYLLHTQNLIVPVGLGIKLPMVYISIMATVLGVVATSFFWLAGMESLHITLLRRLNKAENTRLSAEVQQDKIKQLEAQVHTLETALNKALKI